MKRTEINESCEGCASIMLRYKHVGRKSLCFMATSQDLLDTAGECPCAKCLVKPVCYEMCESFKKYQTLCIAVMDSL